MDDQLLYKVEQASGILQLSRATLYEKIATGEIRSVKIGSSRRIPRSELEAYVSRLGEQAHAS